MIHLPRCICLDITAFNSEDIRTFVNRKVKDFGGINAEQRNALAQEVVWQAAGIFFKWAALLMEQLQELQDQMQGDVDRETSTTTIAEASPGLEDSYDSMLYRIPKE